MSKKIEKTEFEIDCANCGVFTKIEVKEKRNNIPCPNCGSYGYGSWQLYYVNDDVEDQAEYIDAEEVDLVLVDTEVEEGWNDLEEVEEGWESHG